MHHESAALPNRPTQGRTLGLYLLLGLAMVATFLAIRWIGEASFVDSARPIAPSDAAVARPQSSHLMAQLLAGLIAIILAGRLCGTLLRYLGQPSVIGEVIAGIILGPSLLGQIAPQAVAFLFPEPLRPVLGAIAQLGVILYMFLVGLHLNPAVLRSRAHATVLISHASIAVPFLLGAALALWLFRDFAGAGVSFTSFALFLGLSMAITAFPVLARILTDRKMEQSELGNLALACAAVDDVTAWCLLAFVVGIAQADPFSALITLLSAAAYVAVMLFVVRPLLRRLTTDENDAPAGGGLIAAVLLAVLASSLVTDVIGIHTLFGAFLLGAIIPHDSSLARTFRVKLEDTVTILLLPAFFAYTGIRTEIGLLSEPTDWLMCAAIILVATLGKLGGSYWAARYAGLDRRTSAAIGVLMNTRGLMELIVLNIGLDLGILSPRLFAMMVLMALVTTFVATPVLNLLSVGQTRIDASTA